jgi:uncharacterized protein DUF3443
MTSTEARFLGALSAVMLLALMPACGSGSKSASSSPPPTNNSQAVVVNSGPTGNSANGIFTSVTVCAPGTSSCQAISGVLVDTGSFGLRVLSSALTTVSLPQQKDTSGNSVVECAQFVDSVLWGPVKTADVEIAGEKASSIPIQVVDPSIPVPSGCSAIGPAEEDLKSLGANGILGVGPFIQDCGGACTTALSNPGFYYGCSGSSCQVITEAGSQQVQNPVAFFASDNNGILLQLPATPASAPSISGSLTFGIGTQSDNSLGSAQVLTLDPKMGNFMTTFKGKSYTGFIDSGSNAYFFLDATTTGMPTCPSPPNTWYCPASAQSLSATNSDSSHSNTVNFTIDNADTLFASTTDFVFPTLGGPNPSTFDWGLPFFFGRNVFVAIEGRSTPGGTGPFWAY